MRFEEQLQSKDDLKKKCSKPNKWMTLEYITDFGLQPGAKRQRFFYC